MSKPSCGKFLDQDKYARAGCLAYVDPGLEKLQMYRSYEQQKKDLFNNDKTSPFATCPRTTQQIPFSN